MDRGRALEIQRTALGDWVGALAGSSASATLLARDGVSAVAVPDCPDRSIANSVSFRTAKPLLGMHDELAAFYSGAGIEAWTVWVPDFEQGTIDALEAAGHKFDGHPAAMVLDLASWREPDLGDLDWDAEASADEWGRINDAAYGYLPDNGYARALVQRPDELRLYRARIEGETACVLGTIDHAGGDLGVYFVATNPARQGLGLGTRLMAAALAEGRERGLETSSLQASGRGEPVYRALGYEAHFRLNLYERRST